MRFLSVLELLLGIVVVGITLFDLFQSVVLPRPAVGRAHAVTSGTRQRI